uniref:Sulfatase N-terminal domain-containing protein n=1 Tax=Strongyloides stercoralis TaxID=6248 RepID=A0A0K0DTN9_STRER
MYYQLINSHIISSIAFITILLISYSFPNSTFLLDKNDNLSLLNLENRFKHSIISLKKLEKPNTCKFKNFTLWPDFPELKNPYKPEKCKVNFTNNYVTFSDGTLNYKEKNNSTKCQYQCNFAKNDYELTTGDWLDIDNAKPHCDVFEVLCTNLSDNKTIFQDIYLHVSDHKNIPYEPLTFLEDSYRNNTLDHRYNVHLIIIDSISYNNALRGLPKTLQYLQEEYNGTLFKYLNKVALNSLPNANAFLLNIRVPKLVDIINLRPTKNSDYWGTGENYCNSVLDNKPFIVKYYRELNFTTMNGEEAAVTAFNWPNCRGFTKPITHHTTRPYELRLHNKHFKKNGIFLKNFKKKCFKDYDYQMKYLSQFIKKYKNDKHFTYTWLTNIAHDDLTGFFHLDEYFKNFFIKNKKYLDNGFLIFMADHGFRIGSFRNTKQGEYEDANPFLLIAPPKNLQNKDSEIIKNLKDNSNKHISHFDIYATMLDIATEGTRTDFKNMKNFNFTKIVKNNKIKGYSLLREINNKRDCYNMEITSEYCLCQLEFKKFNETIFKKHRKRDDEAVSVDFSATPKFLTKQFVHELNNQLVKGKLLDKCELMYEKENGISELEYALNKSNKLIFKMKLEVSPKGIFEGIFDEDGNLISDDLNRVDRYGPFAEVCVPRHSYRKYCFCKSLLKKNKKSDFKL